MRGVPAHVEELGSAPCRAPPPGAGAPCNPDARRTRRWPRTACPSPQPSRRRQAHREPRPDRRCLRRPAAAATRRGRPPPAAAAARRRSGHDRRLRRPARSARRHRLLPPRGPHPRTPLAPGRACRRRVLARSSRGACRRRTTPTERAPPAATSSRSSCSKSSTRFTQNGRSVARPIERICSRSVAGSVHDAPSVPRPPACDTAMASGAAAPRPTGACIRGTS